MKDKVDGALLKEMVLFGAASISLEKQSINDLNVFPVPDGDTGTNMSLTIGNAAAELRKKAPATVEETAKITASALLRGARGNSGVILSLLFRGISRSLKGQAAMGRCVPGQRAAGRCRRGLQRCNEARRRYGAHRFPPGCQARRRSRHGTQLRRVRAPGRH